MKYKNILRNIILTLVILPVLITQKTETKEYQIDPILKLKLQKCLQDIYFGQKPFDDFLSRFGEQKSLDLLPTRSCNTCCPDSTIYDMTILGSVEITSSSTIVITTTNTSLNDITVLNPVVIHVPTGGHVTIDGTNYTGSIKTNLSVSADQAANTFEITGSTKVIATEQTGSFSSAAFFTQAAHTTLTIDSSLELDGQDSAYVQIGADNSNLASFTIRDDLYIHNAFSNTNNIYGTYATAIFMYTTNASATNILLENNKGISSTYIVNTIGVLFNGTTTVTTLSISNNFGQCYNSGSSFYSESIVLSNLGTATINTIMINNNGDFANTNVWGPEVYNYGTLTTDTISINGNAAFSSASSPDCAGPYIYNEGTITLTNLYMNNNSCFPSGAWAGVYLDNQAAGNISITNITMNNNNNSNYAVYISNPGIIKTSNVSISLTGTLTNKHFNASSGLFRNATDTADLAFSNFTIKINSSSYGSSGGNYSTMSTDYPGIVVLNSGNQT